MHRVVWPGRLFRVIRKHSLKDGIAAVLIMPLSCEANQVPGIETPPCHSCRI